MLWHPQQANTVSDSSLRSSGGNFANMIGSKATAARTGKYQNPRFYATRAHFWDQNVANTAGIYQSTSAS